jgi:hypothetical protein
MKRLIMTVIGTLLSLQTFAAEGPMAELAQVLGEAKKLTEDSAVTNWREVTSSFGVFKVDGKEQEHFSCAASIEFDEKSPQSFKVKLEYKKDNGLSGVVVHDYTTYLLTIEASDLISAQPTADGGTVYAFKAETPNFKAYSINQIRIEVKDRRLEALAMDVRKVLFSEPYRCSNNR